MKAPAPAAQNAGYHDPMVPVSNVVAFAAVVVVIVAIPGPSVLFTISRALTVGRRATLMTVLGNAAGVFVQVVGTAVGMGALLERSAVAYSAIKYAGAAYIVYLGVQAIRHRRALTEALARRSTIITSRRAVRDGFIVGVTNPKTVAILLAVMPGFAVPAAGHVPLQLLVLGSLFPLTGLVLDSVWAWAAGTARTWFARSPRRMQAIGGAGGLIMVGVGVELALTGRKA
jgi:threonine/homoserine/homoserine lactone efflux protein